MDLGFTINDGNQPPNIEGSFFDSPALLQASAISTDEDRIGDRFNDAVLFFENQDSENQTVDLVFSEFVVSTGAAATVHTSVDSVLVGNGSLFTGFFPVDTGIVFAISGSINAAGILNLQEAVFSVGADNERIFFDEDGFSERLEPLPTGSNFDPLFGVTTFETSFFDNSDPFATGGVFVDQVTFTPESEVITDTGDAGLVGTSDIRDVEYNCLFIAPTDDFLCVYSPISNSIEVAQFGFVGPGSATGIFEFCSLDADASENCSADSITDQLLNNPDGFVSVTVANLPFTVAGVESTIALSKNQIGGSDLTTMRSLIQEVSINNPENKALIKALSQFDKVPVSNESVNLNNVEAERLRSALSSQIDYLMNR